MALGALRMQCFTVKKGTNPLVTLQSLQLCAGKLDVLCGICLIAVNTCQYFATKTEITGSPLRPLAAPGFHGWEVVPDAWAATSCKQIRERELSLKCVCISCMCILRF